MNILKGLKVLDISTVLAGPSVASFLAELGAEVLKIENPKNLDVTRTWKLSSEDKDSNISAYFSSINYFKNYKNLDLKNSVDYSEFMELVKEFDIVISNFKKGDDVKLKITDAELHAVNPQLIIGKINGFGSENDRVAYDLILQAETGFMSMNGTKDSGPVKMPVAMIDVLAAHQLKEAILLALYEKASNINFKGKVVEVSLYDAALSSLVNQASNYLMENKVAEKIGSLHPNIAPYGEIFLTKDKKPITFAIGSDYQFKTLCNYLELEHVALDERFIDNQSRVNNRNTLALILQERIHLFNSDILLKDLIKINIPLGEIKSIDTVLNNEIAQNLVIEELIDGILTKRIKQVVWKEK